MYLQSLTVTGFKSFAKKSELEFSTPITAIVGPNGSGKSNVAESFRFVLGEQSVKSMRGKRGEDLIWGGSDSVSRGNRAAVEVVFDNTSRLLDLDFDEVRLERTVHRDGQNEYKINGSNVRLKDIHELLAGAHVGATGHHIISQGEADRIISANARERREMIEDALGLKVFQLKKQEAERKLAKTLENIAATESLRREAAPHLRYLKKQVERAERAIAVQQELTVAYRDYLKREDTYVARRTDQLQAAHQQPAAELARVRQTIATIKAQLAAAASQADTTTRDTAQVAHRTAQQQLAEAQRALSTLEGKVQLLQERIARAQQRPVQQLVSRTKLSALVDELDGLATKALATGTVPVLSQAVRQVVDQLAAFLEREAPVATDSAADDEAALTALQAEVAAATTAVAAASDQEQAAATAVAAARAALESEKDQHHDAERELFAQLETERTLAQQVREIETELQVLERDRADFKRELQEAVTLIGRGVMDYFQHPATSEAGVVLTEDELAQLPRQEQHERRRALEKLKIRLEELGVGATDELLKEYQEATERDAFLAGELSDLSASVHNLEALIADLQSQIQGQFVAGIDKISTEFNRFFTLMFGGGSAALERVAQKTRTPDTDEPAVVEDGVELAVALPNKRVKGLEMLSGGERALTSIALIFAMSQVNPPPFIILDETDAALDEANSRRYGDMIEALSQKSQLILITHNRETMSRAGVLYGITMGADGVSKVLSVKFDEAAAHAK